MAKMTQPLVNKLSISELLSYQSILSQRITQMEYARDRKVSINEELYNELQIKKNKIDSRINQLVELL